MRLHVWRKCIAIDDFFTIVVAPLVHAGRNGCQIFPPPAKKILRVTFLFARGEFGVGSHSGDRAGWDIAFAGAAP